MLFSGIAFTLAMVGLPLVPSTVMRSLATGAILVALPVEIVIDGDSASPAVHSGIERLAREELFGRVEQETNPAGDLTVLTAPIQGDPLDAKAIDAVRGLSTGRNVVAAVSLRGPLRALDGLPGAALIIIAVFSGFARGDLVMFQQMGFGVAVALLLDATVVRLVLVPAAMQLLGDRNWYLPSWLRWLPDVHIDGGTRAPRTRVEPARGQS